MKIVAINGSYRASRGQTGFLLERLFTGARAAGAGCEEVALSSLRVRRCLACDVCQRQDRHPCALDTKDDVGTVFQRIAEADIVVYATPVYVFGISALLKMFLERMYATGRSDNLLVSHAGLIFHEVAPSVCSKPFVSLICCDNPENEMPRNARDFFRTFSRFMDAPLVGELVRGSGGLSGHGHNPERESRLPRLAEVYEAFERAGHELATEGSIRRATARRAAQDIVPVPLFGLLKRLPLRAIKRQFVARARGFRAAATEAPHLQ